MIQRGYALGEDARSVHDLRFKRNYGYIACTFSTNNLSVLSNDSWGDVPGRYAKWKGS